MQIYEATRISSVTTARQKRVGWWGSEKNSGTIGMISLVQSTRWEHEVLLSHALLMRTYS